MMDLIINIFGVATGFVLGEIIVSFFEEEIISLKQRFNFWKSKRKTLKKIRRKALNK